MNYDKIKKSHWYSDHGKLYYLDDNNEAVTFAEVDFDELELELHMLNAVNNHDPLVEALENLLLIYQQGEEEPHQAIQAEKDAEIALAAAKGET